MRPVHFGLIGILLVGVAVGWMDRRPRLEDAAPGEGAGRVHIAYWEKWGSFEADACQAMVDEFNRSQDRIYVHYVRTSEIDRKGMLAIMGGNPPDVIGLWERNVPAFAEAGALMPLDELMERSGLPHDYYIANYLALGEYAGRIYALPTTPATVALFYNRDHFRRKAGELRAAGLDPDRAPRTIEELDRYAAVLSEYNPDGTPRIMGFLPTEPGWWHACWGYYFGGRLMDEANGRVTADCEENVRAFVWLKRYAERYGRERLLQFTAGLAFDSPHNAFIDGKVSMVLQGVWFPSFIRRHRPSLDFEVAPFPTAEGAPYPISLIESDMMAIPRGCPHPEEAWAFVHFVQSRAAQGQGIATLDRLQGKHLPIRRTPAIFREGHPNPKLAVFEQLAASPHSFLTPRNTIWQEYRKSMEDAFQHVWNWVPPEGELAGLTGEARQCRLDELCEAEVRRTLAAVREDLQAKYDARARRNAARQEAAR